MELSKFISETINSIIKGVSESQKYANKNGAVVNPIIGNWDTNKTMTS